MTCLTLIVQLTGSNERGQNRCGLPVIDLLLATFDLIGLTAAGLDNVFCQDIDVVQTALVGSQTCQQVLDTNMDKQFSIYFHQDLNISL